MIEGGSRIASTRARMIDSPRGEAGVAGSSRCVSKTTSGYEGGDRLPRCLGRVSSDERGDKVARWGPSVSPGPDGGRSLAGWHEVLGSSPCLVAVEVIV